VNGVTNLTITLTNPNPAGAFSTLTGIAFTDNFAAQGLVITTGSVTGTPACGGVITANAGTSVISATGITLAAGATCQITVEVRATVVGTQVNQTGAVSSTENTAGGTASATLQVTALPLTPTVTPTATATATPVLVFVPPVIPQVFQHIPQGIFTNPRPNTPTPVVRAAVAPIVVDPAGPVVLRPPSTGDAGLPRALTAPFAW